jgi:hypothetical protein
MPPFGAFPSFGLSTPNFPSLNSFGSSTTTGFPPPPPPLLSNDSSNPTATTDVWSNGLSLANTNVDYNEYAKQLGFLMNVFSEQQQLLETDKTKGSKHSVFRLIIINIYLASSTIKSSKSKRTTSITNTPSDNVNGKSTTSKIPDESHPRSTSVSSSSTSSRRSSSNNPNKTSTSSSSRSKLNQNHNSSSSTKTPTNNDPTMLDPLAFSTAATGGLTFPYFLPSLLSQSPSIGTNNNTATGTYPFSNLSSSLMNPAATLYPFLSPDWFASSSKLMDGFGNLSTEKSNGKLKRIFFY